MVSGGEFDRRCFLVGASAAAGGLALAFAIPAAAAPGAAAAGELNCWLVIAPDDTVTIRVVLAEMGQGTTTALAMLVAEELECDWAKVAIEFVAPEDNWRRDRLWGDMSTSASQSLSRSQQEMRRAGATAREMLIAAAAAQWNVPAAQCAAQAGMISHAASGRSVGFGTIAAAAARIEPPAEVTLKPPGRWKLAGTPRRHLDVHDKIAATTVYAIDVRLPGMLYAAIVHCPVFHGKLKSVDESPIKSMPGVRRVVRLADAVAVVAESWWQASRAVEALQPQWDDDGNGHVSSSLIGDFIRAGFDAPASRIGRSDGDLAAGLAQAVQRIEAEYAVPFLAHATMEPQTCTAHVTVEGVEIWVPTEAAMKALAIAAFAAGVPNEKVKVHPMMLGGGFGRRDTTQDYIREAVLIAKEVEQPVKLLWTREQDIAHDFYRPAGVARLVAGLDANGMPIALGIRLLGPSLVSALAPGIDLGTGDVKSVAGLGDEMPYDVPNYRVEFVRRQTHVPVGFWRGINYTQNVFYRECFVDELAHAAGIDPYLYRRQLLRNSPNNLAVLDAAANKAEWGRPLPNGVFRGIAVTEADESFCAQVVELSVRDGRLRVHRVVSAIDCGEVVNPLSIETQTEGAVAFALSAALYGEITIKDGAVEQSNFHDYEMLRLADMPEVETVIVPSGGFFGGVGEPPVVPLAAALCNAIFAATGRRIRSLPLKNHDLRPDRISNRREVQAR